MSNAVAVEGLVKTYGRVRALDGLDLHVPEGSVLGLLGPNGAGKTTTVRILTTLLRPDAGRVSVAGIDVIRRPDQVRRLIGLAGQYAAVDEYLTGRENLLLVGQLYQLGRKSARVRAGELLERFDLTAVADRIAKTYSGGMRRRLDLAASLVARPRVLFLDEPTTGLDPRSRLGMWEVIAALVADGTTLLLTTQYLEEADRLADAIAVVDHGRVIARGTAEELKAHIGGERLEIVIGDRELLPLAAAVLAALGTTEPVVDRPTRRISVPVAGGARLLTKAIRELDAVGVVVEDLSLHRPTLDDVFLALTGHLAQPESQPESQPEHRPRRTAGAQGRKK